MRKTKTEKCIGKDILHTLLNGKYILCSVIGQNIILWQILGEIVKIYWSVGNCGLRNSDSPS